MLLDRTTLATPAQNLALDEAFLEQAEESNQGDLETFRIWEMPQDCIILGRASRVAEEVRLDLTRRDAIPLLRRCSGGATVVAGPGCLMYSVILSYKNYPHLRMLDQAHQFVMQRVLCAVQQSVPGASSQGICDLTQNGLKFSGNALRCKRDYFLYHGTILYRFDLAKIFTYLLEPPRQPDYRQMREHELFVANISIPRECLVRNLCNAWRIQDIRQTLPWSWYEALYRQRYLDPTWHLMR